MATRYPDELAMSARTLTGFSKNLVKLTTQTQLDAEPNSYIQIKLPENQLVNMKSLSIHADLMGFAAANTNCVLPRDSSSYFDQVFWEINGVLIDGSCTAYNHLAKLHNDFIGENRRSGRSVLNLSRDIPTKDGAAPGASNTGPLARLGYGVSNPTATVGVPVGTNPAANSDARDTSNWNAFPIALNHLLGFGSCGKVLDTSILGEIKLILKTAPSTIVMGNSNASPGVDTSTYALKNIRAYVEVLDIQDGTYYRSIQEVLQNGNITIPFKKFYSVYAPAVQGTTSIRSSIATQSLDAVYLAFLRNPAEGAASYRAPPVVANGVAPAFDRVSANIRDVQFDVSGCLYPQFAVTPQDAYYVLQNTLGLTSDNMTGASAELNHLTWLNDLAVWSFRFNYGPGVDTPKSGIDSRGVSLSVVANVNTSGAITPGHMPLLLLESTAWLNVSQYRAISLVN